VTSGELTVNSVKPNEKIDRLEYGGLYEADMDPPSSALADHNEGREIEVRSVRTVTKETMKG
jgi:hypothetical protein